MEERRDAPRRAATRDDWEINEMPAECAHFKLTRRFSESELEALKLGHVPAEMEDHWFCYWEDGRLFIHRSWTGNCIYVLKVASRGSTHDVTVNRCDRQYTCTSIDEDLETLNSLLNGWTGSYHPLTKNTGGPRTVFHNKTKNG